MTKTFKELMQEITDWQDSVFTKATPLSAAEHLRREVKELIFDLANGNPETAKSEMADCLLLIVGIAHLSGIDLEAAVEEKMIVNRRRVWGVPDEQGVVEHVHEEIEHERDGSLSEWVYEKEKHTLMYEGKTEKWQGKTLLEVFEEEGLIPPAPDDLENILIRVSAEDGGKIFNSPNNID